MAVLEKEADKASMAVNTEEEQAQKQASQPAPESVIPEAAGTAKPDQSEKPEEQAEAAAPVIPEADPSETEAPRGTASAPEKARHQDRLEEEKEKEEKEPLQRHYLRRHNHSCYHPYRFAACGCNRHQAGYGVLRNRQERERYPL